MKRKNQFGLPQLTTLLFQLRVECFAEGKVSHQYLIKPANKRNLMMAGCDYSHHRFMDDIDKMSFYNYHLYPGRIVLNPTAGYH